MQNIPSFSSFPKDDNGLILLETGGNILLEDGITELALEYYIPCPQSLMGILSNPIG
jgi:hypothetical protein